jgi:hypothetical protein
VPGIFTIDGMGLQFPPGSIVSSIGDDGVETLTVLSTLVRLDLWPTWLEVGCTHTDRAMEASAELEQGLPDKDKGEILTRELQEGLVAITACAFAVDGFYDVVRHELGDHPHIQVWRKKGRVAREKQVVETLRYRLKIGPKSTANLKLFVGELFKFRGRAVHPSASYIDPNYRPEIDSAVHPHFITFSGRHAEHCRALTLEFLDVLINRARELSKPGADRGWLDKGRQELDRLIPLYPAPPVGSVAFARYLAGAVEDARGQSPAS